MVYGMSRDCNRRKSLSATGLEPVTFGFGGRRSIQLSYADRDRSVYRVPVARKVALTSARATRDRSPRSLRRDHHVRGFDDREHLLAGFEPQLLSGIFGDNRDDLLAAGQLDDHFRVHRAVRNGFHFALEHISRADF